MRAELPVTQDPPERGRALLRDGRASELRPVGEADRAALAAFFERLADRTLADRIHRLGFDPGRHACLGLWTGSGDDARLLAVGAYEVGGRGETGPDVVLAVADDLHGHGLGTILLERLVAVAAAAGMDALEAHVAGEGASILALLRDSGFAYTVGPDGDGLRCRIETSLGAAGAHRVDERDRLATIASLAALLRPASVAVVGASERSGGLGRNLLENLLASGYTGRVYPVHPHAATIAGKTAYPSVEALPEAPDLVVVAVPEAAVGAIVDAAGRRGARALAVITAGYGETGPEGRARERALVAKARGYGMRILGPNCLGVINTARDVRMNAVFTATDPLPGSVAMGSQSGALGVTLLDYARAQGLGVSSFVSLGNKADISGNDLLQYWQDDPETRLIVLYLESFGNSRRFAHLARRVGRHKPILVVKAGRSAAGVRAASSHTAALAASETAVEALFRQTGVVRADTLEELFDGAALLARQPLPAGGRVAVVTNAGGPGILATDALAAGGLELPLPSAESVRALRRILPSQASLGNPVDMIASASVEQYAAVVRTLLADSAFDAAVAVYVPPGGIDPAEVYRAIAGAARSQTGPAKPLAACFLQTGELPMGDVPVYRFPESAGRALAAAARYAAWRREPPGELVDFGDVAIADARAVCKAALDHGATWLAPEACRRLLTAMGIRVLALREVRDPEQAVVAAREIGFPVAVKMVSSTLLHKSDWQGVRLGLGDEDGVRRACVDIERALRAAGHGDALEGFVVEAMAPAGLELMAGSVADPLFGPLVAFGLGGVDVEDRADVVLRIAPLTDRDAWAMLSEIRGARRLGGTRGRPAVDRGAVVDLLLRLSRLLEEVPAIRELDLNPVVAGPAGVGVVVVDARVRVGSVEGGEPRSA